MNIRHLLFEEDDQRQKPAPKASPPNPALLHTPPVDYNPPPMTIGSTPSILNNTAYQKLSQKINFNSSDTGITLAKYLTPLMNLPIDEHAKYKAAVAQASAQEGLTVEKILATFDALKNNLQGEADHFEETAKSMESEQGPIKLNRAEDLLKQITSLTKERDDLLNEIKISQKRIEQARKDFNEAVFAIGKDIETQKQRYAGLLKG